MCRLGKGVPLCGKGWVVWWRDLYDGGWVKQHVFILSDHTLFRSYQKLEQPRQSMDCMYCENCCPKSTEKWIAWPSPQTKHTIRFPFYTTIMCSTSIGKL